MNNNKQLGHNRKNIAVGGKTVYGGTVGVCMLDTQFPRVHGDIANARTGVAFMKIATLYMSFPQFGSLALLGKFLFNHGRKK